MKLIKFETKLEKSLVKFLTKCLNDSKEMCDDVPTLEELQDPEKMEIALECIGMIGSPGTVTIFSCTYELYVLVVEDRKFLIDVATNEFDELSR